MQTDPKSNLAEALDDEDSWREWYRMAPLERWHESMKLWQWYLQVGGTLDPEPDTQSPFDAFQPRGTPSAYGGQACVFYGATEFSRDCDVVTTHH